MHWLISLCCSPFNIGLRIWLNGFQGIFQIPTDCLQELAAVLHMELARESFVWIAIKQSNALKVMGSCRGLLSFVEALMPGMALEPFAHRSDAKAHLSIT